MPLKRLCLNTLPLELGENTLIPLQPCLCSFEFDISSPSCPDEGKWEGVTLDKFVECEEDKGSRSPWRIVVAVCGGSVVQTQQLVQRAGQTPWWGEESDLVGIVK